MARKLKVFRTAIGFHDAYVAAPSRKAALAAWGTEANLFAQGLAEEVDEPALTAEPLAHPGAVVKQSRGTAAEQIAALPKDDRSRRTKPRTPPAKRVPKPSRDKLAAAEAALAEAGRRQDEAMAALTQRIRALERERAALERDSHRERDRLTRARDAERDAYERAIRDWPG